MGFNTTLDFKGKKYIDIITMGREHYRISIILAVVSNGFKLPPFIIVKGEPGKTVEKDLRNLPYIRDKSLFLYCQNQGWCTTSLFKEWINVVFKPYEEEYGDKCLLIMDKASSHISKNALTYLNDNEINYVLIPGGMTPECQPLDISVNKIFKDNIKYLFEKDRLFYDSMNNINKLKTLRINLIDYINRVWYNDTIITKEIIIKGFRKAEIINNYYLTSEEEKIRNLYRFDVMDGMIEIEDDLGKELNINPDENVLENDSIDEEEEVEEEEINNNLNKVMDLENNQINEDINIKDNDIKNTINDYEKKFSFKSEDLMDIDMD